MRIPKYVNFCLWLIVIAVIIGIFLVINQASQEKQVPRKYNYKAVIGFIDLIYDAQEKFRIDCYVDQDNNKVGEYGFFEELSGIYSTRSGKKVNNPIISKEVGEFAFQHNGIAKFSGYFFKIYLPTDHGMLDRLTIPVISNPAYASNQESDFVVYAWPEKYNETGQAVFCMKKWSGIACSHNNVQKYSGFSNVPPVWAAFSDITEKEKIFPFSKNLAMRGSPGTYRPADGGDWYTESE